MRRLLRSRPTETDEHHRATNFEIFFDLVFVFALTRIIAFMGRPPTFLTLAQGLLLLFLMWYSWQPYVWLGNQARADVGLIRAGTAFGMAALFVAALVIPDAFRRPGAGLAAPLTLAVAFGASRSLQLVLYFYVAADDRRQRQTLTRFSVPTAASWIPLVLGAVAGGSTQTVLWLVALVIDTGGGRIASAASGWLLRSASHFSERHSLVVIIALGESLISVGAGAGRAVTRGPVMVAALLGLATALCLWWLYFEYVAPAAARALAGLRGLRRGQIGGDAYSITHFGLIAGIIYVALGIEQVLHDTAGRDRPDGQPLGWVSATALYGGVVLYLAGRATFTRLTLGAVPASQAVAAAVALALVPAAQALPALAALGLLTAFLVALSLYEWRRPGQPVPAGTG
ncbi:low temperature requirement protein A [Rugosimonospora africana]|uniref:Low temperature requirement protein A n=1 Tax=Rugosimonospora africana TaxID=556532 RepID=A0A8J3VV05_9ACTN|nr:low temperature requirement protein A [Rugosimonospora africana]GIH19228.1 low temperature requirement protein A [Rugosimonospora africana]